MRGLKKFWFQVVDPNGEPIIDGLKVSILTADGAIATIYDDEQASSLTNPITEAVFDNSQDGIVTWWSAATSFDVEIVDEKGRACKVQGFTGTDHRIVFDPNRMDSALVYANTAFSDELTDTAGTFTDFSLTRTIAGEDLKAGDVVEIMGHVLFEDFDTGDTLDLKVLFGTETVLQTGDVTPAADDDSIFFHAWVTVKTAGSSGKLYSHGYWMTDLDGTGACNVYAPGYADAAGLAEDLSGDIEIKCQGDWSAEHGDNECVLSDLKVFIHKNGNV